MEYAIVHYSEIGLKKRNRAYFENKLVENIKAKIRGISAKRYYGYIILSSKKIVNWLGLGEVPGISHYYLSKKQVIKDINKLKKEVTDFFSELMSAHEIKSFRITTERHDKNFKYNSEELNNVLGEIIVKKYGNVVRLKNPDLEIFVKVCDEGVYMASEKMKGLGGLPVGSTGRAICLLSGGIDSPVAAYLMMKRGLQVNFIHFKPETAFNHPLEDKIRQIVEALSKFQPRTKLIVVNFSKIQKEIIKKVHSKYRMLIYRRFMLRIAQEFNKVLILGDSVSQVASQTLDNLQSVYSVSKGIILSPLLGIDKEETIKIAREIGTYKISIQKYPDCCSFFVSLHPVLKASSKNLDEVEKNLDIGLLVDVGVRSVVFTNTFK